MGGDPVSATVTATYVGHVAANVRKLSVQIRGDARAGSAVREVEEERFRRGYMATITKGRELMTLINVFAVSPDKQEELAQLLVRATDETMRSARPHMQAAAALASFEPIVCAVVDFVGINA